MNAQLDDRPEQPGRDATETGVRVRTHPAICAGWGNCHRFAPDVYALDDDGHVAFHLLEVPPEHALDAWRGASVCPEHAISVAGPPEQHWVERQGVPTASGTAR